MASQGKIKMMDELTRNGFLEILAIDHRGSLKELLGNEDEDLIKKTKGDIVKILSPHTSATLLDPIYGKESFENVSNGLLVSRERSGYTKTGGRRKTKLLKNISAKKIRDMGGSAVKLLIYYNPKKNIRKYQEEIVKKVSQECKEQGIPFLCEVSLYSIESGRNEILVNTAKRISSLGIDILKTEAPTTLEHCKRLDSEIDVPWVVLSGGLGYEKFKNRVKIACKAGASGYAGGRGIWQDCIGNNIKSCLKERGIPRINELNEIVEEYGSPIL